jgi:sortase (surface protein transpeptidase)
VPWRATAALVAELGIGVAAFAGGLLTVAASASEPTAATTAITARRPPPAAPATISPVIATAATVAPATSTTSTTLASTVTTRPNTAPATSLGPVVTHHAAIDVLAPRPIAAPVRVSIPVLDIDGPVVPAGVNSEQELDVPPDARSLVWYRHGPSPGERGSAVIAGHLNWRGVTGLFADVANTPVGAVVTVAYDDGSQRSFTVTTVELVPKPAVAVNGVFARDGGRVLRLVTCGGEFDDDVNSYRSNVVVTAVPA